ncbi:MAG: histidine phosphatase family protein [Pseudomonadota bacterium]|nr:histidine phosphatase family protein [Pseudomonadota bacterium]
MTILALVRHGLTSWNENKLVQGRSDIPLSKKGRMQVGNWRVPDEVKDFFIVSSPLIRAKETARALFGKSIPTDDRLVEMNWSEWEGRSLNELRSELGNLMEAWEAKGLDFRAPGGESPREVQQRLKPFMRERAKTKKNTLAVCHKGVIRAVYALSINWDMTSKPPQKLKDDCVHLFELAKDGTPSVQQLDLPMIQDL